MLGTMTAIPQSTLPQSGSSADIAGRVRMAVHGGPAAARGSAIARPMARRVAREWSKMSYTVPRAAGGQRRTSVPPDKVGLGKIYCYTPEEAGKRLIVLHCSNSQ